MCNYFNNYVSFKNLGTTLYPSLQLLQCPAKTIYLVNIINNIESLEQLNSKRNAESSMWDYSSITSGGSTKYKKRVIICKLDLFNVSGLHTTTEHMDDYSSKLKW